MNKMIADRYMIIDTAGEGGMADVYVAMDTILNREVAVKILRGALSEDPVTLVRFLREASAISKLHHPNVVEVYDVGEFNNQNYIVMEYVRGRTLKQLILQRGALQKEEAVEIMKQLVSAVSHAHENDIIHRDIKPQNVLVKDDGTIKITDFGIALAHNAVQLTQVDAVLGSAHYIAPETTKGEVATEQIDIYALGIVFYELLSGSLPHTGDNPIQIAMKHLHEEIPSIREFNPTLPQSVENIIIKATAKNRKLRYQNAKEMYYDLVQCLTQQQAEVEKLQLEEENDAAQTKVMDRFYDTNENKKIDQTMHATQGNKTQPPKKSRKKIWITLIILLVVATASFATLVATGVIRFEEKIVFVEVPDVTNMSVKEATQAIEEAGLILDEDVEEAYTKDVEEGLIYEQIPAASKEVKKGTIVQLKVSEGLLFVVEDYAGLTKQQLMDKLIGTNITILEEFEESSTIPEGIIISQSLLNAGDLVEPNVRKQIRIVVAKPIEFFIGEDYTGMDVQVIKAQLEEKGLRVNVIEEVLPPPNEEATEEEIKEYNDKLGEIFKQDPVQGNYYTQVGDNVITLWSYK